jgi:putative Mg2+ transporter-C (MgtC) family protein
VSPTKREKNVRAMLTNFDFVIRLIVALLLGALIGIERQWLQKSAALRINILVSLAVAAFILISVSITSSPGDLTRIAGQIVTSIGFLGASIIMKAILSIQGLNTAGTLWCSAPVGCLAAIRLYTQATSTTIVIVLVHLFFRPLGIILSHSTFDKSPILQSEYLFAIKCRNEVENHIRVLLMQYLNAHNRLLLHSMTSSDNEGPSIAIIMAEIFSAGQQDQLMGKITGRLIVEREVTKVKWEKQGQQNDL